VTAPIRSVLAGSLAAIALAATACSPSPVAVPADTPAATPVAAAATTPAALGADGTVAGVVAETMNSGGYTYARLTAAGKDTWSAATEFSLKTGDQVTAAVDMPMENFRSRTLNRDFPLIYFVREVALNGQTLSAAAAGGAMPSMANSHGDAIAAKEPAAAPALIAPVPPAPGGVSVADVWARRAALAGKPIVIRGKVVKANYEIMGTNWYHLQDGSGKVADGTHDLVITSSAQVKVDEVVTVSGVLTTDKDFGAGYAYEAIVEQADIKK
jgi:hypothetical protein